MPSPISKLTGGALAVTGAVLAIAAVAVVLLLSPSSSSAAAPTTISLQRTSVGTILVGPGGQTLYAFTRDGSRHDACASVHGCLQVWPIMAVRGSLTAGHGVHRSLLGTITVHGARQVTYAGHPLYRYPADDRRGDTGYVGVDQFGGRWPAVNAAGRLVH